MLDIRFVIFGSGNIGRRTLKLIGAEKVAYYCDNSAEKIGKIINNKKVISFSELLDLKRSDDRYVVIIGIGVQRYRLAVERQLLENGIYDFCGVDVFNENARDIGSIYMKDSIISKICSKEFRYRYVIDRMKYQLKKGDYLIKHADVRNLKPATGELRKKQLELVEFSKRVIDLIKVECGVDAWIDYGALLGKQRHNGFIPWDDDIDFGIMRNDISKVVSFFAQNYLVYYAKTLFGGGQDTVACLENGKKEYILEVTPVLYRIFGWSKSRTLICVDFFVWDYYDIGMSIEEYHQMIDKIQSCVNDGVDKLNERLTEFFSKISSNKHQENVLIMPGLDHAAQGIRSEFLLEYGDLFPLKEMEFEGKMFVFPHNIEKVLEFEYGDWQSIPDDIGFDHKGEIINE